MIGVRSNADSSTAVDNTIYKISRPDQAITRFGHGPLAELSAFVAANGAPHLAVCNTVTVSPVTGAMNKSGTGPAITLESAGVYNDYDVYVKIVQGGALTTASYQYSFDGGETLSDTRVTTGSKVANTFTGVDLTFAAGTYVAGDVYTFSTTGPKLDAAQLTGSFDAVIDYGTNPDFGVVYGGIQTAAQANANISTINTECIAAASENVYFGVILDGGSLSTANVVRNTVTNESDYVIAFYDYCSGSTTGRVESAIKSSGYSYGKLGPAPVVAARLASSLISTDPKRVDDGPLAGVYKIGHDERTADIVLDDKKISTLRSWMGRGGYYVTNAHVKATVGSDLIYAQHRRIIDLATALVHRSAQRLIGRSVPVLTDGTGRIKPSAASRLEREIQRPLKNALVDPTNVEGDKGHISDLAVQVDRENDVLNTRNVIITVSMVPLGYVDNATVTIQYVASLLTETPDGAEAQA
jgi:hypothetical protein